MWAHLSDMWQNSWENVLYPQKKTWKRATDAVPLISKTDVVIYPDVGLG